MFRRSIYPISLVFVIALATSCGSGGGILGSASGSSVSLEQEWQLGKQLSAEVDSKVQLNRDARLNAYVRDVGERIHARTPLSNLLFDFKVINDDTVNA